MGGASENVTRRRLLLVCCINMSGETRRSGELSGESGGEEHRSSSMRSSGATVSNESKLRLLESCISNACLAVLPKALNRVLCSTTASVVGVEGISVGCELVGHSVNSLSPNEKDFNTNSGAPGPPKRIRDPRLTLCGTTTPSLGADVTRTPLTKVPWALPQSTR